MLRRAGGWRIYPMADSIGSIVHKGMPDNNDKMLDVYLVYRYLSLLTDGARSDEHKKMPNYIGQTYN